ncbi:MAG: sodium-dependent bicarbonate transport family permease [Flavobacteriia bacterium]|nr:sodium-dependent bicarbonate transport family permease [Flavobacteriia bacterium]
MSTWSIAQANLTSVGVLGFIFGFIASRVKSDVRVPDAIYQFLSIYLLFGMGLKGGHSLKSTSLTELLTPALATLVCGVLIPLLAFGFLKFIKGLNGVDRGSIAAHYGSTSLVTFSAAILFLESNSIFVEGFAPALLTLMEIPGLIVGIFLASRSLTTKVGWGETMREVLLGKTVLLLLGGLLIGFITSIAGYEKVSPFFVDLLSGFLVLFLIHLGYLAGSNFVEIKSVGKPLALFALTFPVLSGAIGVGAGSLIGLSVGGATALGVLCASASYIAAPAAVSVALPTASPTIALVSSIGITFPFNLIFGIPIYFRLAEFLR